MFGRILKKDLRRKRTTNIILLLFIILATMFLAGSVDNLLAVNGAIDHFLEISRVPDFLTIATTDGETDEIADFLRENEALSGYEIVDTFNLSDEDIVVTKRQEASGGDGYERTNTLCIQAVPVDYMKVFNLDGSELSLKPGEIAFPKLEAEHNHLTVGDEVRIKVGDVEQSFTVAAIVKDAVFGSSMMGFKRLIITEKDFARYEDQGERIRARIYSMDYSDKEAFQSQWRRQSFSVISGVEESTVHMCYIMDMLIAVVLIVVSICMILLAFMVLRFTIVFTIQEDYREIGIMKAIGVRNRGVGGLYLIKYLVLTVSGAVIGCLFSFPFGEMILEQSIVNIVVERAEQKLWVNVVCTLAVVGIVLGFCVLCMNKLKKISVLEAVRSGSNGERYRAKHRLKLWKRSGMRPYFYMAVNDILSSMKQFVTLLITFCLGTMLILLPLSAASTLKSDSLINSFSLVPSDAFLDTGKREVYTSDMNRLFQDIEEIETTLRDHGLKAVVGFDMGYMIPCYANDPEKRVTYYALQAMGSWERHFMLTEGTEPKLPNEIMITELTAEELGVKIGDTVYFAASDGPQEFIITGTYSSMLNLGQGYRVARSARMDETYGVEALNMQVEIEGMESKEACERLKEIFPDYKVMNTREFMNSMIGDTIGQLDTLMLFIVLLVLVLNSLITVLVMRIIMAKERGGIALLKSIGFADRSLRAWQTARVLLLLAAAIVLGTVLSNLLAPYIIGPIFAMMGGTYIELVTGTWESYAFYPLLLLAVTWIAAALCAAGVRKVDVKEVNNIE